MVVCDSAYLGNMDGTYGNNTISEFKKHGGDANHVSEPDCCNRDGRFTFQNSRRGDETSGLSCLLMRMREFRLNDILMSSMASTVASLIIVHCLELSLGIVEEEKGVSCRFV